MRIAILFALIGFARLGWAEDEQGVAVELAPLVVTGNFQLQLEHPQSERVLQSLTKAIREKEAKEAARDPIFNAKFWHYLPQFGIAPDADFFIPSYSSAGYRKGELQLRASEKNALIAP